MTPAPLHPVSWAMMRAVREQAAPTEATDWLDRCRAGDPAAWRQLYDDNFPFVYRLAVRMGASEREAADIAQEVFLRAWRALRSFRGDSQLRTWLYRITLNEVARAGRESSVRRAFAVLFGRSRAEEPTAAPPDRAVESAQALAYLQRILELMKPKQRTVFVLFELEELALEEIARIVAAPLETVRSRLRHARADFDRLRRQLQAVGSASRGGTR